MRLLHTRDLRFEEFFDSQVPRYAILSHRWIDGQEVSYEEFLQSQKKRGFLQGRKHRGYDEAKSGFMKIRRFAQLAFERYKCEWCWIDTCCIDKKSSAELSEAINSMWRWYQGSDICIVYLHDVSELDSEVWGLKQSDWFTRGWTLQELLAPSNVRFYSDLYEFLGTKYDLAERIQQITNIEKRVLRDDAPLITYSVAQRMSWASRRKTTRSEDVAYCLLGLFDVNMPLIYGEGKNAFMRLQIEIMRQSNDESIFAWTAEPGKWHIHDTQIVKVQWANMLAPSPAAFRLSSWISNHNRLRRPPYAMTNRGLELKVPAVMLASQLPFRKYQSEVSLSFEWRLIRLDCCASNPSDSLPQGNSIHVLIARYLGAGVWFRLALPYHLAKVVSYASVERDFEPGADLCTIYVSRPRRYGSFDIRVAPATDFLAQNAGSVKIFGNDEVPSLRDLGFQRRWDKGEQWLSDDDEADISPY